jgi:FAD dependent monooxygenase
MSRPVSSLTPGDTHTTTALDYSTLLFTPSSGSPQWFLFSKMPQRYVGKSNIPRFTNAEMESTIQKFSSCLAAPGITVGALMESANRVGYFSLEEANHAVWSFGRIVCVGDAIHKMTPNIGQGGNQAIESAAVLTNCLWEMLRAQEGKQKKVGEEELKEALKKYQRLRQGRAKMFVNISGMVTRNEALASLRHVLKLLYEKPISGEELAGMSCLESLSQPPHPPVISPASIRRDNKTKSL